MTPEGKASEVVRLRASEWGCRLFRNNSGVLKDARGVPVRFGLGNESPKLNKRLKSSDFIGYTPVTVTPEMVGKTLAVFTALEVKPDGTNIHRQWNENSREWAQQRFIDLVKAAGGLAGFATNQGDVDVLVNAYIAGLKS